jgi:threonine 3-dehydrogenase
MIDSGLDISPVITHRLNYRDFQTGFDVMNSGEASKVILNWEE